MNYISQRGRRCSEKAPSASLSWSAICSTSQNTQQTLLWPWTTSSVQTWALHIWAAPPYEGQPYSSFSLPASPEGLVSINHSTTPSQVSQQYPSNAAALTTGWALGPAARIPSSVQTGTHPAPYFNMPKLCLVPPTPCTFAFCPWSTILSYNSGL